MRMCQKRIWVFRFWWIVLVVGLPVLGSWLRRHQEGGCALDGLRIDPFYEVRIIDDQEVEHRLCCVQCAIWWLERHGKKPQQILVTDEESGRRISSESATFVRSGVITHPTTGNRVHVFQHHSDAERHAVNSRGTVLSGSSRPFEDLTGENQTN